MSTFRLLAFGQIAFFGFLVLCFAIDPVFLKTEGGVSNYGVHAATIIPYTLAFGSCAVMTTLAARQLKGGRTLRIALYALAVLLLAVLVSTYPYKINGTLDEIHQLVSQALFVYELGFGAYLTFGIRSERLTICLFSIQFLASLAALLTVLGVFHLLFVSQILTGAAFSALQLRAMQRTV
jgi:hypothetical protein